MKKDAAHESPPVEAEGERFSGSSLSSGPPAVPDHQLLKKIGGGSYGEVWLARNVLGEFRAVKVVYRDRFEHERPYEREFEGIRKFEPISRLHDSQVDILHVGRNDEAGFFYYVMELADAAEPQVSSFEFRVSSSTPGSFAEPQLETRNPKPETYTPRQPETRNSKPETYTPRQPETRNSKPETYTPRQPETRNPKPETYTPRQPETRNPKPETYLPHTLKLDLHRRRRLPVDDCLRIGLALCRALEHLHAHGLVHRDIKPSNIIFVGGVPKLADIGLVTDMEATRSFVGTEGFIPPEGPGTVPADLYSLGKVLYEMSMGRSRLDFPALPLNWDDLPADEQTRLLEFNEVLVKACDADCRQRYQSAEQLHADLALLQRGQSVKRKRAAQQRWAAAAKLSLIAGLMAMMTVGGFLFRHAVNKDQLGGAGGTILPEMKGTRNREAWNAYLNGLHYYKKDTQDGSKRAIEYLKEATRLDPNFAPPYAVLAEVYRWNSSLFPSDYEALTKAKEAALQALTLNDSLAQAHKELGYVTANLDRDFSRAEKELKRALELSPDYATGHAVFAWILLEMRRLEEAKKEIRLCLSLDPVFPRARYTASVIFLAAGEVEEALGQLGKALDLDPNYRPAFVQLGEIHEEKGQFPEAIEMFRKAAIADGIEPGKAAQKSEDLLRAFSTGGARRYWWKKLELADARSNLGGDLYDIAVTYLQLGQKDSAFEFLNKVEAQKSRSAFRVNYDRRFDGVRSDPRFLALLQKLRLANSSATSHGDTAR